MKIMTMQMLPTWDKAKTHKGNIRGLNLAAVRHTTFLSNDEATIRT
jgi:hypothetical protein